MLPFLSRGQLRQSTAYHRTTVKPKHCDVLCQTLYRLVIPNLPRGIQKENYKHVRESVIVYLGASKISPSKGPSTRDEGVENSSNKLNKTYYDMSVP